MFGFMFIYVDVFIVYEYNYLQVIYKCVSEFICFRHINSRNDQDQE